MLKEKFKEVGRLNNEIYKEDLLNIKDSILGISGSYFTKKIFENIYQYQDHSIGMSKKMLESKVVRFKNMVDKYNIQIIIVFENLLSVRLNQRNSILKKTLITHNVQFINTPYSEHAQLIYYFKNNLISGIVSDLDIIKYFSETNNYVIIDFNLDGEQFEWIHLSKFLASMNLTHHYARQLLLQEQSQRKVQKDVIEQFDSIQKQKNFDRDSSVNHPSYKDQIFRIEYVPIINLSCNLQFYKQTIETPSMEDRMKKHFGILLPPTLYQFFAFDLISSDIFNIFGYQRFKYVPNIYDSKELKILIIQTSQHYSKVISLIKQYLPETSSKSEIFNIISENEEYSKEKDQQQPIQQCPPSLASYQSTQPIQNYEYVYSDIINEPIFSLVQSSSSPVIHSQSSTYPSQQQQQNQQQYQQFNNSQMYQNNGPNISQFYPNQSNNFMQQQPYIQQNNNNQSNKSSQANNNINNNNNSFNFQTQNANTEANIQNEFQLLKILQKYLDLIRKSSKNPSRKNSENLKGQQLNNGGDSTSQRYRNRLQQSQNDGSEQQGISGADYQRLNTLLTNQQNLQNQLQNSDTKSSASQNNDYDEGVRNTPSRSLGQNPSISAQSINKQLSALQIYSLAALNFFNLQELIILSKQQITLQAKYLSKCSPEFSEQLIIFSNIIQNQNLCNIFFSNLVFDPEESSVKDQKDSQIKEQVHKDSLTGVDNPKSTEQSNENTKQITKKEVSSSQSKPPQCTTTPPLPPSVSSQSGITQTAVNSSSVSSSSQNQNANQSQQQQLLGQSIPKPVQNPKELISRKLIDDKLPLEEKHYILVISRLFSLSELSFKDWKNEEIYDFELTQFIKIIQSFQSILRNQFDCLMLCSYCYINSNHNMQSVLESKKYWPFRKNYNCGMGMLIILLLQNKLKLEDILKDEDNFPFLQQELIAAFLLWDNIFSFVKQQQTDKYVDPSIVNIYAILSPSNDYLFKKIDRKIIFGENTFPQQIGSNNNLQSPQPFMK